MKNFNTIIEKKLPFNNKINLILFQGDSCSGKTTFSTFLYKNLKKTENCSIIHLDDYYRSFDSPKTEAEVADYDFDNPAAFDWEALEATLYDYAYRRKHVVLRKRDITTKTSRSETIINNYPKILILEGIYAFNLINPYCFNIKNLDPFRPPENHLDHLIFTKNPLNLYRLFNLLKIRFELDKTLLKDIRLKRDVRFGFTKEEINHTLESYVLPGISKWNLNQMNQSDILIKNGTFNDSECNELIDKICSFYHLKGIKLDFYKKTGEFKMA
ncbi:hypothetical protein NUSPORA_00864 [Nucleospora cyclopteri]